MAVVVAAMQIALVDLLASWNIQPSGLASHSMGEIAAAYAVGALSLAQAVGITLLRMDIFLKHKLHLSSGGGMLAAGVGPQDAAVYISKLTPGAHLSIACINSPTSVTLSGHMTAIDEIQVLLKRDEVLAKKLNVSIPFHSQLLLPIVPEYSTRIAALLPEACCWDENGPSFASPVTGGLISPGKGLSSEHWVKNLVQPTLFSSALESMVYGAGRSAAAASDGHSGSPQVDFIIEIGAHSQLAGPIRGTLSQHGKKTPIPYSSCLKRSANAIDTMQDLAALLVSHGYPVDLAAVNGTRAPPYPSFVPDLPSYPWTHQKRYWSSSRLIDEHKFPRHPAHQLLGLPVAGSNTLTPSWRHFLRLSDPELGWLVDHQVDGMVVFPGAGFVSMAIEAARMVVDPSEGMIRGYKLRDVEVVHALQIPDTSAGVEVLFQMEPCSEKELSSQGWWDFKISSAQAASTPGGPSTCVEHCRGSVSAEKLTAKSKGDWRKAPSVRSTWKTASDAFSAAPSSSANLDIAQLFANLRSMGIYHGPAFQNLKTVEKMLGEKKTVVCDFDISMTASRGPVIAEGHRMYPVHPTTLDSAFLAGYAALDNDMRKDCFYVPRSIRSIYVPKDFGRSAGHPLRSWTELTSTKQGRGFTSSVEVVSADSAECHEPPCSLVIEGLLCQAVPRDETSAQMSSQSDLACGRVGWVPQVLHNLPASMKDKMRLDLSDEEMDWEARMRRGAYYLIRDAVSRLDGEARDSWSSHHKKLMAWMDAAINGGGSGGRLGSAANRAWATDYETSSPEARGEFLDHLGSEGVPGRLLCRLGAHLADIIRGRVTPLELMVEDGLLGRFYETLPCNVRSYQHIHAVVSLFAASNPGAKVLEIGAGTGGATTTVINALSRVDVQGQTREIRIPTFAQYDFTDVSAGFFDAARSKFEVWDSQGLMIFKRLDIEKDPEQQPDFDVDSMGTYDLVVASLVLHATANLERTMRNVHKLLRPGGTLVMIEYTSDRLDSQLIFGTLPGWWLSEEPERAVSPAASLDDWGRILRATGFTNGVEIHVEDCESDEYQTCSVVVSTATPHEREYPDSFQLVYMRSPPPDDWFRGLRDSVRSRTGADICLARLEDAEKATDDARVTLFLDEMQTPVLHAIDSDSFEKVRRLLVNSRGLLWATCGGSVEATQPQMALAQGLLRTIRQEDQSKRCILLDFEAGRDADTPWTSETARHIAHTLQVSFDFHEDRSSIEFEYAVRNNVLLVPRVFQEPIANEKHAIAMKPFWNSGPNLTADVNKASGSLGQLYFVETSAASVDLPPGYVEIEPRAFGLNFRDVLVMLGEIDGDPLIGQECSGVVTGLGPGTAASGLSLGDRVCAMCADSWGTRQRALWQCAVRIPDTLSWAEAAIIPIAYGTAWICLQEHARMRKGESVLVHAATGGFGQAVVTLARHLGAGTIFATCGTPEKRDLLVCEHGLLEEHIFSSRNDDFASAIMEITGGKGVDVIINSLAGPLFKASWDIIARNGRFVDVGKRDSQAGHHLDMRPFRRCATITAVDLAHDALDASAGGRPLLVREAMTECVRLLAERAVKTPAPVTEYAMSEMEKAMRLMQAGNHLGKMVLVPRPDDLVRVAVEPQPVGLLQHASYLVAGGAGGIGASIARWMIEHGAKHLVLVSRHARSANGAEVLVRMGAANGCDVQLHDCDIGDDEACLKFATACQASLPPVRGIVTGAMVLDDTILESMTYSQWQAAIRPKVNGTWNLHKTLGGHVDFFIMLSSLVGTTGNASQANYAAGNTFQDALARHRTRLGKPAVSLALGVVANVGYVAKADQAVGDRTTAFLGGASIDPAQILSLVEEAVRYPLRADPDAAQVLVGIPRDVAAADSGFSRDRRFSNLRALSQAPESEPKDISSTSLIPRLLKRLSVVGSSSSTLGDNDEVKEIIRILITMKLAEIFSLPSEEINLSMSLAHYGVDSLVGVELRNWLSSAVKVKVTIFEILQSRSVEEFSELIMQRRRIMRT